MSVTFAINLIELNFSDAISVTILGSVKYRTSGREGTRDEEAPVLESGLMGFVGGLVTSCNTTRQELELSFGEERAIILIDDSENYESFIIRGTDLEIIV